jgi:hypothetical protein
MRDTKRQRQSSIRVRSAQSAFLTTAGYAVAAEDSGGLTPSGLTRREEVEARLLPCRRPAPLARHWLESDAEGRRACLRLREPERRVRHKLVGDKAEGENVRRNPV